MYHVTVLRICSTLLFGWADAYAGEPSAADKLQEAASISVHGQVIIYNGYINEASVKRFKEVLASQAAISVAGLRVTSGGGDPEAGLDLAALIHGNKLSVTVEQYCVSACANYLALAGRHLSVPSSGVLAFHGGAGKGFDESGEILPQHKADLERAGFSPEDIKAQLEHERALYLRESSFYRSLGISRRILDDSSFKYGTGVLHIWMYTRDVLEDCYGVRSIASYPELPTDKISLGRATVTIVRSCRRQS